MKKRMAAAPKVLQGEAIKRYTPFIGLFTIAGACALMVISVMCGNLAGFITGIVLFPTGVFLVN